MPKVLEDPHDIDGPVIVKYAGAKGGRGYFIARDYRDFRRNVDIEEEFTSCIFVLLGLESIIIFYLNQQ